MVEAEEEPGVTDVGFRPEPEEDANAGCFSVWADSVEGGEEEGEGVREAALSDLKCEKHSHIRL